jgi:Ca2+-binding RTX toxin-like protein
VATFNGTLNSDTLLGSSGDDIFHASGGVDRIWGGTGGNDRLVLTGSFANYSFRDNGDGTFTLTDLRSNSPDGTITFRDLDELSFSDGVRSVAQAKAQGLNFVTGTSGNDTLVGSAGSDELRGGAGDDRIWGSSGADVAVYSGRMSDYKIVANGDGSFTVTDLRGGINDGTDIVRDIEQFRFSDGTATLSTFVTASVAAGLSVVQGGSGNDNVLGTSGNDVLIGKAGDDHIWGGVGGTDTVVMSGRLADYAIKANGNGSFTVTDRRGGVNDGIDIVRDVEMFRFADVTVSLDAFRAAYDATATNTIAGTSGNDVLLGTSGNDVLLARGGNDRMWGGKSGNDTAVFTGKHSDYVVTDNGNGSYTLVDMRAGSPDGTDIVRDIDVFRFADRTMSLGELQTGAQRLVTTISGTASDDLQSGANTSGLQGANTNDMMIGSLGNDTLRGGAGNDLLIADGAGASNITASSTTSTNLGNVEIAVSTTGVVTFVGETAGYRNALGCYKVDANGNIYDVKILFANASLVGSGGNLVAGQSSVSLDLQAGDKLGFFVVSNGFNQTGMAPLLSDTTGSFKFVGPDGVQGNVGTTTDLKLVHVAANGTETVIRSQYGTSIFHSTLGTNGGLNVDDITHVTGVTRYADGSISLGFEDLLGGGDRDYDDSVFSLQVGTANTVLMTSGTTTTTTVARSGGDYLVGGIGADTLIGGAGNDVLAGGAGADQLIGGDGKDSADYSQASAGVEVDLTTGGLGGEATGDTYVSVEMVIGSAHADVIRGTVGADVLSGLAGDDRLEGRAGSDVLRGGAGADTLLGGDDFDTATYYDAGSGVTVDLGLRVGTRGDASGDVLVSIERVQGSNTGDDVLIGSSGNDELQGYGGNDWLTGGAGKDVLGGGDGNDTLDGGEGNDVLSGGAGADLVLGGAGQDLFIAAAPALNGSADTIDGGDGIDLVDYSSAVTGVLVDLAGGGSSSAGSDTILNVEVVIGSAHADTFWGDAGANEVRGGAGNDSIRGGAGDDLLLGQDGNDVIFGDGGSDTISGGSGFDRAVYESNMADYGVQRMQDGTWIVTWAAADQSAEIDVVLQNVEQLVFADATLDLATNVINNGLTAYDYLFQV